MSKKKVVGVGGIFFKCRDPKAMNEFFTRHLGMKTDQYGSLFEFRNTDDTSQKNYLQLSPFPADTKYFDPSDKPFMINFRVENLEELIEELREAGVEIVGEIMRENYGLFAHILDPEGNKIELWEPVHSEFEKLAGDNTNH